jgi:hypothetical protein
MRRFLFLWLLLGLLGLIVSTPLQFALVRNVDLRFEPFLTTLLGPALSAILLLRFVPELRDPRRGSLQSALREPHVANTVSILLLGTIATAAITMVGITPRWTFDLTRGLLAVGAAVLFARARQVPIAALLAILGVTSGQVAELARRTFLTQPVLFRWMVCFGVLTVLVLTIVLRTVTKLRESSPNASTFLEWSLAPASAAAVIVIGNLFWRPHLTPAWWLLANILGCLAMGVALLAALSLRKQSGS